jgi:hypothetical protein
VGKDEKYVDPDQQAYTSIAARSPEQIEMRLNGRKRPVNPKERRVDAAMVRRR